MSDSAMSLSDLTPARLVEGEPVPVPGAAATATLLEWRYGRGRTETGRETLIAWARVRLDTGDGDPIEARWRFGERMHVRGQAFYLTGSRSEVLLYGLPDGAGRASTTTDR